MTASPPPGSSGWPLLGETLAFGRNGFSFIDERLALHGDIFKTHLLGREAVVISGPKACEVFIDGRYCMREGSMPPHIQKIFAGRSLPLLDGDDHRDRKTLVLQGFTPEALASYLPTLQKTIETALLRWETLGEFGWLSELKRLALTGVCANTIGLGPGPELEILLKDYQAASQGISSIPIPLPGTTYSKALKALERIFVILDAAIRRKREKPGDDALSRILAARTADGVAITDAQARLELHHIVVAGYIIFAEFAAAVIELHRHPDILRRLQDEVRRTAPTGPLTMETMMGMPLMMRVVMEVKRLCPILPAIFGKARQDFEFNGFTVPQGWMVLWALRATNTAKESFTDPKNFDPERFSKERAEHKRHEHSFVPHGPGPALGHKCPGADYSTWFMIAFLALVLRGHAWELPERDFSYAWDMTPPEPRGGLRARISRRP